jgi:hypothetical protein
MILEHLLHRPGDAALALGQRCVEIEAIFLLDVQPDQRGVRDHGFTIADIR